MLWLRSDVDFLCSWQFVLSSFTFISLFLLLIVTPLTSFSLFSWKLRFKAEMVDNMLIIILLSSLSYLIILLFLGGVLNMSTHALRWTTMWKNVYGSFCTKNREHNSKWTIFLPFRLSVICYQYSIILPWIIFCYYHNLIII